MERKKFPFLEDCTINTLAGVSYELLTPDLFPNKRDYWISNGEGARFDKNAKGPALVLHIIPPKDSAVTAEILREHMLTFRVKLDETLFEMLGNHTKARLGLPIECCGVHATYKVSLRENGGFVDLDETNMFNLNQIYPLVRVEKTKTLKRTASFTATKDGTIVVNTQESTAENNTASIFLNGSSNPIYFNLDAPSWNKQVLSREQFVGQKLFPPNWKGEVVETLLIQMHQSIVQICPGFDMNLDETLTIFQNRKSNNVSVPTF